MSTLPPDDQADRLGDYLRSASGDSILRDVERFTRSNPWLVAGGGLVLGFAASRFLKASSSRRYHSPDRDEALPSYTPSSRPIQPPTSGVDADLDPLYAPPVPPVDPLDPYGRRP